MSNVTVCGQLPAKGKDKLSAAMHDTAVLVSSTHVCSPSILATLSHPQGRTYEWRGKLKTIRQETDEGMPI